MATAKKAPAKKAAPVTTPAKQAAVPAQKVAAKKAATPATPAKKGVPVKTGSAKVAVPENDATAKRAPNSGFMKTLTPSAALAAVVGAKPLPRTEVVKQLWVYIKNNNLQDAEDKRKINADAKLKEVFGKDQVSMFEMSGLIGKHLT